jgi:hypothetical protein
MPNARGGSPEQGLPEGPRKPELLDVVYEVLSEELGEEEAQRLLELITARLDG